MIVSLAEGTCEVAARSVTAEDSHAAAVTLQRLIAFAKVEPLSEEQSRGDLATMTCERAQEIPDAAAEALRKHQQQGRRDKSDLTRD